MRIATGHLALVRVVLHLAGGATARYLALVISLTLPDVVRAVRMKGSVGPEVRGSARLADLVVVWFTRHALVCALLILGMCTSEASADPKREQLFALRVVCRLVILHGRYFCSSTRPLGVVGLFLDLVIVVLALAVPFS